MVSLKIIAAAYVAVSALGVDAAVCHPGSRTSLSLSYSRTRTLTPIGSTSTSTDATSASSETETSSVHSDVSSSSQWTIVTSSTLSDAVSSQTTHVSSSIASGSSSSQVGPVSPTSTSSLAATTTLASPSTSVSLSSSSAATSSSSAQGTTGQSTPAISTSSSSSIASSSSAALTSSSQSTPSGSSITTSTASQSSSPTPEPNTCDAPAGNLIFNPSFELDPATGPYPWIAFSGEVPIRSRSADPNGPQGSGCDKYVFWQVTQQGLDGEQGVRKNVVGLDTQKQYRLIYHWAFGKKQIPYQCTMVATVGKGSALSDFQQLGTGTVYEFHERTFDFTPVGTTLQLSIYVSCAGPGLTPRANVTSGAGFPGADFLLDDVWLIPVGDVTPTSTSTLGATSSSSVSSGTPINSETSSSAATSGSSTISTHSTSPGNPTTTTPVNPTSSSSMTPQNPTTSTYTTPQNPTSSSNTTPRNPTSSSSMTPQNPTSSSTSTPQNPTSSSSTTPQNPTSSSSTTPRNPTTTPTNPTTTPSKPTTTPKNPTTTPSNPTTTPKNPTSTPSNPTTTPKNPTTTPSNPTSTPTNPTTTSTSSACSTPTNLFRSPGFEPSADGEVWGFYYGPNEGIEQDSNKARSGDYVAYLSVGDGEELRMEQRINSIPGTEYALSFWYALDTPMAADSQCIIGATYDYYTLLAEVTLPTDTNYHQYSTRFIASATNPAIEIRVSCPYVGNGYTATVYIDDTSVLNPVNPCDTTPVDPNTPTLLVPADPEEPRCPINLVQSPSFDPIENNQPWGFYYGSGEIVDDASKARTGDYSAILPAVFNSGSSEIYVEQRFNLNPGEEYAFTFFWKAGTMPSNGECVVYTDYNYRDYYADAELTTESPYPTGYNIYSIRFVPDTSNPVMQIGFYCETTTDDDQASVYIDDVSLTSLGGCEAYPSTGAFIENPSFEIRATEDSTYAWFGTSGVTIKAGTSNENDPQPLSGNNFLYSELDSTQTSSTIVKPLASDIPANVPYQLVFYWAASAVFEEGDCSFTFTFGSFTQTLGISYLGSPYSYLSYTLYFTPTESASTMQITTSCEDISGFPAFIFDDFSLNYDAQ